MAKKPKHLNVIYFLTVLALTIAIVALIIGSNSPETGEWVCLQQECSQYAPGGDAWRVANCGLVNTTQGPIESCRLLIDGQEQLVPAANINFSVIQVCEQYACIQEVRVRSTNYTLNAS